MSGSKSSDASFAHAAPRPPEGVSDQPLGLTVHTLPHATEALVDAQRTRGGRWKMLGVLLVCAAPVIASYFTYYVIRPESRRNYGELIDPQPALPQAVGTTLEGAQVPLSQLKGQWLLVSVSGGACEEACQKHLYLQRQLREALGKEKDRMDWVWLISDAATPPQALQPALHAATVLRVDDSVIKGWLSPAPSQALEDHLYLVDPLGHWMLRFPAGMDAAGAAKAKRDLERLMRASSSWDQPGRAGTQ